MRPQRPLYEVKAELFKALSHPVRIRILELLVEHDEVSVGEMLTDTNFESSHLSQHLRVLKGYGLVESNRRASQVYYRLIHPSVSEMLRSARHVLSEIRDDHANTGLSPQDQR